MMMLGLKICIMPILHHISSDSHDKKDQNVE